MGVSRLLRLGVCSALLITSCGSETEPLSEAAESPAASTTSTAPPPGSSSTQQLEPDELTPPQLLPAFDESFSVTTSTKAESGLLIDGEYVSDQPDGAFRWSSRIDVAGPQDYRYYLREGQAEAGDAGCFEIIKADDTWHIRSTFDPEPDEGNSAFVLMDEAEAAETSEALSEQGFPRTTTQLFETLGITSAAISESSVFEADVAEAEVDAAITALWATWSFSVPASGTITVTQNSEGELTNVVLEASGANERGRSESVIIEASIKPLDVPMLLDSPRPDVGFCRNQTLDTVGRWALAAVVGGGTVAPVDLLPPEMAEAVIADAFIEVQADGAVSGSTGCQTFEGTIEFGYRRWLNPRIEFSESVCSADQEDVPTQLKDALLSGPSVGLRPETTMWLVSEQVELGFLYDAK